ncbi:MAG: winged helix-turn-helix domain-containing protein [Blastocatellia bacterium]|nr:winged helix-turn-helix domain-containing protein [Blastocatellia bacterium]
MPRNDLELALEKTLQQALTLRRTLRARIAEAENELRALRRRAVEVDRIIEHTQAALRSPTDQAESHAAEPTESTSVSTAQQPYEQVLMPRRHYEKPPLQTNIEPTSFRFRDLTITQAATIVLREAGGPLHVNAIFNKLLENGFEFRGDHPTISLAVSLNRCKRFRKVAPSTFDLVIRDVPVQRATGA